MPYDLLSGLANALLDGTVFQIVNGLKEVQEWEERTMFQQRSKLVSDHKGKTAMVCLFEKYISIGESNTVVSAYCSHPSICTVEIQGLITASQNLFLGYIEVA